jgi:hypothetical protein
MASSSRGSVRSFFVDFSGSMAALQTSGRVSGFNRATAHETGARSIIRKDGVDSPRGSIRRAGPGEFLFDRAAPGLVSLNTVGNRKSGKIALFSPDGA